MSRQCVGARRCPLVVSLGYQHSPHKWHRDQADAFGMIVSEPQLSVAGIDSALKLILKKFAVDPHRIAVVSAGGQRLLQVGGHNQDVFNRIAMISFQWAISECHFGAG